MDNKDRLRKLNEHNNKNESINNTLKDDLDFSEDSEFYKFLIDNDYIVLYDPLDEYKIFILRKNEYFILKHLYENKERPFGTNELCNEFDFEIFDLQNWLTNLVLKKLIENSKIIEGEIYYFYPNIGTVHLIRELNNFMEMQYFLTLSKAKNKKLIKKDSTLKKRKKLLEIKQTIKKIVEIVFFIVTVILILFFYKNLDCVRTATFLLILFIFIKFAYNYDKKMIEIDTQLKEIESEIELERLTATKKERRAEQLFRINQFELSQYYNEILKQSKTIFKWGIICIVLGITLIVLSVLIIGFSSIIGLEIKQSQIIAIISAIGGLFSNIVAGFYMNMYNKTMKSLDSFHQRFVGTHHLHFGNLLLSKIDDRKLREEAYASIFKDMVVSMDKTDDSTK